MNLQLKKAMDRVLGLFAAGYFFLPIDKVKVCFVGAT